MTPSVFRWILFGLGTIAGLSARPADTVVVAAGQYRLLFKSTQEAPTVRVESFALSVYPVSNDEFLAFVRDQPRWRRSHVAVVFADADYLRDWASDLELGPNVDPHAPVTRVSWFAARAYCAWRGGRLPSWAEWEYAAALAAQPSTAQVILNWYAQPGVRPGAIGRDAPDRLGLHNLHGLIWEWVDDFNSALISGDSRGNPDESSGLFCAGGATGAVDPSDYAAFMRSAFRSSLRATYTLPLLGFRCAYDL